MKITITGALSFYTQVKVIELYRPPDGYFGFQISPTIQDNKLRVFISGFGHGLTDKLFTGLLSVGRVVFLFPEF